ncbi:MAG: riboflavin biosynthesis protein RibF [Bacteroidota bacterium]|nr:riboflavin biosynthesis protein RibF [Bacteroidota bacterium]
MKIYTDINNINLENSIVTIGVFDGVHIGHQYVLKELKRIASEKKTESTVVTLWPHPRYVLNKDANDLQLLNTLEEKQTLLAKADIDNLVIIPFTKEFASLSSSNFIKKYLVDKLKINELIIGFDHHFGKNRKGGIDELEYCTKKYKFEISKLSPKGVSEINVSSTKIRNALLNGDIEIANEFLGYNYFISGRVVRGNNIGQKIGFPTANIKINSYFKVIPSDGVYAVMVNVKGIMYRGMLNIGNRPTINIENKEKCIEVNIFDFDEDIYNEEIRIEFYKKIRKEKKFKNIETLKKHLLIDENIIRDFFENR